MNKGSLSRNIHEISLAAVIVVLAVLINIRSGGNFLTAKNMSDMFVDTSILVIATMGMMSVIIAGGIDLSTGSMMALSGMVATTVLKNSLMPDGSGLHPLIILAIAVLTGALCGALNGFVIARLNVLPIIATLGSMNIFRGVTYLVSDGSWVLQQNMTTEFMAVATGKVMGISNLILIALAIFAVNFYYLGYTRPGRRIYACGNSVESASVSGINTKQTIFYTYVVNGALSGLAGVLYVCRFAAAQGETATGYELNVIASCVLGGVSIAGGAGKVHGALLGAIMFGMLNNALPLLKISPFWQEAIRGLIIFVSILISALIARRSIKKALERRAIA